MHTLYRKYRPKNCSEVLGQDVVVDVIKKQISSGNIAHAYLFSGPRGTGKTSMARLLAKAVNCLDLTDGSPCGKCSNCVAIDNARFLDLLEIDAASNRGIDEIRRLRDRVNFSPNEGKYKVYIIDEVHMLTRDAFNALLKTLEEPPLHVIFILATTESHKIPQTILSRCQRFNFKLASDKDILKKLKYICKSEKVNFTDEALNAIVTFAEGSFRDAESILEKVMGGFKVLDDKKIELSEVINLLGLAQSSEIEEFINALFKKDQKKALAVIDNIYKNGINLSEFISQTLEKLRKLMIEKVSEQNLEYSLSDIVKIISELQDAQNKLKTSSIERLPLEISIIKLCVNQENTTILQSKQSNEKKEKQIEEKVISIKKKIIPDTNKEFTKSIEVDFEAVDLEKIKKNWKQVVEDIKPFNHHLSAFFVKAVPVRVEGQVLVLQVPFRFHKSRIESPLAQKVISGVTHKLFSVSLSCFCEVVKGEEIVEEEVLGNGEVVLEVMGDLIK